MKPRKPAEEEKEELLEFIIAHKYRFRLKNANYGITVLIERLFYDAVGQVRYLVAFANLRLFEADVLAAETVEETDPFA